MKVNMNTRLIDLNVGDLLELIQQASQNNSIVNVAHNEKYVYGIDGIANFLGCSKTTVHEYRKQGWIEPSIKQFGRKVVCDTEKALELLDKFKNNKK